MFQIPFIEPLMIEVFLYKHNYKDRLIIGEIKQRLRTVKLNPDNNQSFAVLADDVLSILQSKFKKDLNMFDSLPPDNLADNVNSVFFLNGIIQENPSLKYITINVSDVEKYSRLNEDSIVFAFKLNSCKIDLGQHLNSDDLQDVCTIFQKVGIYSPLPFQSNHLCEVYASELYYRLDKYIIDNNLGEDDNDNITIQNLKSLIGIKAKDDDTAILFILMK